MAPAGSPSNPWRLEIVRCPNTGERLLDADASLLERLNRQACQGALWTVGGESVPAPIAAGLVTESGGIFYLESADTLLMLSDQAIALDSLPA